MSTILIASDMGWGEKRVSESGFSEYYIFKIINGLYGCIGKYSANPSTGKSPSYHLPEALIQGENP
jgi:hypothetical protein